MEFTLCALMCQVDNVLRNLKALFADGGPLLQKKVLKLDKNMNQFCGRKLFQKNTSAAYLRISVLGTA